MAANEQADSWAKDYEEARSAHIAFTEAMNYELEILLDHSQVSISQLEARTKTVKSFSEKISRKNKYVDPLQEITDLSGLRIIVPGPDHISSVGELVKANFKVDQTNSLSIEARGEPDRFGYRAEHYVVELKEEQLRLPAWERFKGYCAEIQIRTVMQHAWAAVDHKVRYKGGNLPDELQRRLFRLNALLEIADEQFAALLEGSEKMSASYADSVERGDLAVDLDALSLGAFLEASAIDRKWGDRAVRLGYRRPASESTEVGVLLDTMRILNMDSLQELQQVLDSADSWGEVALERILEAIQDGSAPLDRFATITAHRSDVLQLLLLFNSRSQRAIRASDLRIDIQEALLRAISI